MTRVLVGERKDGSCARTMRMTRPSLTWMNESESPTWVTNGGRGMWTTPSLRVMKWLRKG